MKHPISTLPYEMNSVLEAGTDLNDYRTAGIFFFSYANRPTNLPPDGYGNGWCLVLPSSINSENYCTQIWISFGNNATTDARNKPMARRTYFNGTWTDWWKLPCTGEYTSSTDVTNAITTALADYIPHNTTEITATTEAEFEQMMEALPQSPPKTYFFHVLQGTSTRIGLPTGRYGIQVYTMGSTLRSVIAYSYNNDQKTYKKIRTAGTSGTWSSWFDITNTDSVSNLQTQVGTNTSDIASLQTQVGTNTTDIGNLQTSVGTNITNISNLQTQVGTNTSNISNLQTAVGTNTTDIATLNNRLTPITQSYDPYTMGTTKLGFNTPIITKLVKNPNEYPNFTINEGFVALSCNLCQLTLKITVNNTITPTSGSYMAGHLVSAMQTARSSTYMEPIYSIEGKIAYVLISGGGLIGVKPIDTLEAGDYFVVNITYPIYYSYDVVYEAITT